MPIGTYTPPPGKSISQFFFSNFFFIFFYFRCILLQISHQKCFFISISIPGRSGVNDFFVNVGKNLTENIKSDIDPLKYIANNFCSLNTIQVTEDKILSIISAMKNSAPGFDELPAFLMKQCSKLFIKPLCHVLSLSIRQGVFPIELKLAKVLPIYKSDDKRQLKNYRPISVLPFI